MKLYNGSDLVVGSVLVSPVTQEELTVVRCDSKTLILLLPHRYLQYISERDLKIERTRESLKAERWSVKG